MRMKLVPRNPSCRSSYCARCSGHEFNLSVRPIWQAWDRVNFFSTHYGQYPIVTLFFVSFTPLPPTSFTCANAHFTLPGSKPSYWRRIGPDLGDVLFLDQALPREQILGNGLLQLMEVVARKKTGFQLSDAMFRIFEKGRNVTTLLALQLFYAKRGNAEDYCHRRSLRIGSRIRYTVQSLVLHLKDMRRN